MAAGYDGSIRINTKIDTKGAEKGASKLSSVVKKLGGIIAAAFAVSAIKNFVSESTSAYKTQMMSEQKLTAQLQNRYKATRDVIQSVYDLTAAEQEAGVVGDEVQLNGLSTLSAYIDNLEDLKALTGGMNDILAFNYGFDSTAENASSVATAIGKAIKDGSTRSLVAMGVAVDENTEKLLANATAAERVEIINKAIAKSVGGVNEKLAQTPYGQIQQLKNSFGDMKEVVGQAALNFGSLFVPALKKAVEWATSLANRLLEVSKAMRSVFGMSNANGNIATSATEAAQAQESVAEAVEDTGKAIAGNLAGFDEITTMQTAQAETDDAGAGGGSISSALDEEQADEVSESYLKITATLEKLKAYLEPIVATAKSLGKLVLPIIENRLKRIQTVAGLFLKAFSGIAQAFAEGGDAGEIFGKVMQSITGLVSDLADEATKEIDTFLTVAKKIVLALVDGIKKALPQLLSGAVQIIDTIVGFIFENIPKILEVAKDIVLALVDGVVDMLPVIVDTAVNLVFTLVTAITDNLPQIVETAVQIVVSLVSGLLDRLPDIVAVAFDLVMALITGLIEHYPDIIKAGWDIITSLVKGIFDLIPKLWETSANIVTTIWDKITSTNWLELGKNILLGIGEGIKNAVTGVVNTVKTACKGIWDGIKGFFGIHSPSTLMRDTVGNNIALGIGEGFTDELGGVTQDMQKELDKQFSADFEASRVVKMASSIDYTPTSNTISGAGTGGRDERSDLIDKLDEVIDTIKDKDGDGGDIVIQVVDRNGNVKSQKTIENAKRQNRIAGKTVVPVGG